MVIDAAFAFYGILLGEVAIQSNLLGVLFFLSPVAVLAMLGRTRQQKNTLGSARFANFMDVYTYGMLHQGGIILGKTRNMVLPTLKQRMLALYEMPFAQSADALNICNANDKPKRIYLPPHAGVHTACLSPTGGGKSTGHAIPNLLTEPNSVVVLDYKGELLRETGGIRARMGDVICIAPFGLPEDINFPVSTFNPLQLIDPNDKFFLDDAAAIANSLVVRESNEMQPFFNNASELIIKNVLVMMLVEASAEECTLGELRNIITVPQHLEEVITLMMERPAKHKELMKQLGGQLQSLEGKERSSVLSTINTHLSWLDSIAMRDSLSLTSFQPGQLFSSGRPLTIYVHIPVHRIATYRGYIRTLFSSLINFIFHAGESRSRRPVRFYLDESYGLGPKLHALYAALIYGRSFGIRLNFYFQALSQIEEVFAGPKAKDFRSNVITTYTGIGDYETAKQVSQWIGRQTIETIGHQRGGNFGTSKTVSPEGRQSIGTNHGLNYGTMLRQQARELLQPEEILQLPKDTTIITVPHMRPIIAQPDFFFKDKRLSKLAAMSRKMMTTKPSFEEVSDSQLSVCT